MSYGSSRWQLRKPPSARRQRMIGGGRSRKPGGSKRLRQKQRQRSVSAGKQRSRGESKQRSWSSSFMTSAKPERLRQLVADKRRRLMQRGSDKPPPPLQPQLLQQRNKKGKSRSRSGEDWRPERRKSFEEKQRRQREDKRRLQEQHRPRRKAKMMWPPHLASCGGCIGSRTRRLYPVVSLSSVHTSGTLPRTRKIPSSTASTPRTKPSRRRWHLWRVQRQCFTLAASKKMLMVRLLSVRRSSSRRGPSCSMPWTS
mmetsp:Transcript_43284/g.101834  ORF Transcript_43284/g.101834 Transcript_43284/m.101834 type:complete len:255 (+) Transcript_43284:336-1100(+)